MHSLSADSTLPLQKAPMKWQVLPTVVEGLKRSSRQQAMAIAAMLHKMVHQCSAERGTERERGRERHSASIIQLTRLWLCSRAQTSSRPLPSSLSLALALTHTDSGEQECRGSAAALSMAPSPGCLRSEPVNLGLNVSSQMQSCQYAHSQEHGATAWPDHLSATNKLS